MNLKEAIKQFLLRNYRNAMDKGYCMVCGRDAVGGKCRCCKRCGCVMRPCRCEFDNERDFLKYGEMFTEIVVDDDCR